MIKKRIKKISKLVVLISVRQGWKLGENLYHLIKEPFLTLKRLKKDKDKSQTFLITLTLLMPIIVYVTARVCWDYYRYGLVTPGVGIFFRVMMVIQILFLAFLGYWTAKVFKKKND
jgi:hypothetical protein